MSPAITRTSGAPVPRRPAAGRRRPWSTAGFRAGPGASPDRSGRAVPHSDEELLDFDTGTLEDWDEERARAALDGEDGALYRNHLHMALRLDQWARAESRRTDTHPRYRAGYVQALEDVAAFLRQTYYLPADRD